MTSQRGGGGRLCVVLDSHRAVLCVSGPRRAVTRAGRRRTVRMVGGSPADSLFPEWAELYRWTGLDWTGLPRVGRSRLRAGGLLWITCLGCAEPG